MYSQIFVTLGGTPAFTVKGAATLALNPHRPFARLVKAAKMAARRRAGAVRLVPTGS